MPQIQLLAAGPVPTPPTKEPQLPHVLLLIDGFPKALGGGERIALRMAELMPRFGFRASILILSLHPQSSFKFTDAPCPIYLLPLTSAFGPDALYGALALRAFLREQEVKIVQTFFESSDLWGGLAVRSLSSAKLIWSRRDMGILRQPKHSRAYRALRHLPHAVFAVSERVAEHVIQTDGVPATRVRVVYNGLDAGAAPTERGPNSRPVITTIGNIRRVKGHDLLLKAAPTVLARFPAARFTFAGEVLEPEYFAELQAIIAEHDLAKHVSFLGKITDLQQHLAGADLFVLPSRSEGFSNALVEAMADGLPVVATDVGGNAEAIESGVSGIIVEPDNVEELAKAMLRILSDDAFAAGLRSAARLAVQQKFTADAMMRTVSETYRKLLEK